MTSNPYAHPADLPPENEGPQRVSLLAIASLVFGLLCCIPGVGLLGTLFGGAALVRISGSRGRLAGRGMALVGLILGVLGTVLWVALTLGLMASLNGLRVYGDTYADLQSKNHGAVRAMLDPATSNALTDEQLDAFAAKTQSAWGGYAGLPKGMGEWFSSYMKIGQQIEPALAKVPVGRERKIPLPLKFANGGTLGIFVINPTGTGPTGAARIEDMAFMDKNGQPIWLLGSLAGQAPAAPQSPTTAPSGP